MEGGRRDRLEDRKGDGVHEFELDLRHGGSIAVHHLHGTSAHLLLEIALREELPVDILLQPFSREGGLTAMALELEKSLL